MTSLSKLILSILIKDLEFLSKKMCTMSWRWIFFIILSAKYLLANLSIRWQKACIRLCATDFDHLDAFEIYVSKWCRSFRVKQLIYWLFAERIRNFSKGSKSYFIPHSWKVSTKYIFTVFYLHFRANKINMCIDIRLKNINPYHPLKQQMLHLKCSSFYFFSPPSGHRDLDPPLCWRLWVLQLHSDIP